MERATVKMEIKYGGDVSRLTDIFRCTLIFDSLKCLYAAVHLIANKPSFRGPGGAVVTEIQDRFLNPLPKKYGDVLVQVVIDGIPGELQLNVRAMHDAKTTGGGHASYRVRRFTNEYLL